jgi:predicted nucleic acid-binding protein
MPVVPDVSAILGQALDDEDATFAESVIAAIARDEAVVPTLFWYEIRNVLVLAERRKRIAAARTTAFLSDLALLQFSVDDLPREASVLDLARRRSLTVYDAAYLELAQRTGAPLATLDHALRVAAKKEGIALFRASATRDHALDRHGSATGGESGVRGVAV